MPDFAYYSSVKFAEALMSGDIADVEEFTVLNGLQHPLVHQQTVTAVCSYLLYVVSCHTDPVLVNAASNALAYHAEMGAAFAPDRAQILAIALNMGMKEERLQFFRDELPEHMRRRAGASKRKALEKYPEPFNVQQFVECLTKLLRPGRHWTDAARYTLFSVLVAMLADPYMESIEVTPRVTVCVDALLRSYERAAWSADSDNSKLLDLVEALGQLPVEARLPVLAGLPPRDRGLQLRSLAGYLLLQHTIFEQQPNCLDSCGEPPFFDLSPVITVGNVLSVVRGEQVGGLPPASFASKTAEQLRSCYAVLRCVDAAVGSEPPPNAQHRKTLLQLKEFLNSEIDRVPDTADDTLELRISLKDFMTMLFSKWSSMCV
ncbi:uncharacterized protein LOC122386748 isoform X3 [Amphibalanus amphitrite]|uniref:uncharacterized protein LOC122386748 isoform X3 n=1 Tax=Amphibalanus amphitrite TaxID=1232801 RepID=UPI001C921CBC|nr:uncharacterized protein LOC122386748 isoform X3 [Amphibalanus amphitrite]